jgi:hypothetical protein
MATVYRLTRIAAAHRGGMNQAIDAEIRGVGKSNAQGPFTIANEVITARLGQTLGLPVPAGVVAEGTGGTLYYLSLDVSKEGKALPPAVAVDFAQEEPRIAAGCVVFDILIANSDRHAGNLARDPGFDPPRPSLFDHGHALLGTAPPSGLDRLVAAEDILGCLGTDPLPGNRQCLIDHIADAACLRHWIDRVAAVPDFIVEDVCAEAVALNLLQHDLAAELASWINRRRKRVHELVCSHKADFPSIQQWDLPEGEAQT